MTSFLDVSITPSEHIYHFVGGDFDSKLNSNLNECYGVPNTPATSINEDTTREEKKSCPTSEIPCLLLFFFAYLTFILIVISASVAALVVIGSLRSDLKSAISRPQCSNVDNLYTEIQMYLKRINGSFNRVITHKNATLLGQANKVTLLANIHNKINSTYDESSNSIIQYDANIHTHIDEFFANVSRDIPVVQEKITADLTNLGSLSNTSAANLARKIVDVSRAHFEFQSCETINTLTLPFPSGQYLIQSSTNNVQRMNCSLYLCHGVTGNWRRVTYLNSSDPASTASCPEGLETVISPKSCRNGFDPNAGGCSTVKYAIHSPYKCIFGRVSGYIDGTPDGFEGHMGARSDNEKVEDNYVDGVVFTYGKPKRHIWTYAAASIEYSCTPRIQPFLQNTAHYTCEVVPGCAAGRVCGNNSLWNGGQSVGNSTMYRQFQESTAEDIEMRVCRDELRSNEDVLLTFIEIYVA